MKDIEFEKENRNHKKVVLAYLGFEFNGATQNKLLMIAYFEYKLDKQVFNEFLWILFK